MTPEQHLCFPPFHLDLVNERLWRDAQAVYKAREKLAASRAKPVARLTVDVVQFKEVAELFCLASLSSHRSFQIPVEGALRPLRV